MALLHELQVHQVELELQAEELRAAHGELDARMQRQREVHDSAPVGLFVLEPDTRVHDLNRTGAALFGTEPEALVGRHLDSWLVERSARALRAMVAHVAGGRRHETGALELAAAPGAAAVVQARVSADPAGGRVLVALLELSGQS